ncbi:MAG TPA: GreA/GreB family elongation factor [Polyangiaceae bacterium]|nr:GreA/GreB family elongation factor [Polyangiaceae bacterium]
MPLLSSPTARTPSNVLDQLDGKLANSVVVPPEQVGPDLVTMNSKVLLACPEWGARREYQLVYPNAYNGSSGIVRVLSVLGAELLAARVGARFAIGTGANRREIELVGLSYQPESAGHWTL